MAEQCQGLISGTVPSEFTGKGNSSGLKTVVKGKKSKNKSPKST